MTREERELLFKDLCSRLPYGVKLQKTYDTSDPIELYSIDLDHRTIKFYKYKGECITICDVGDIERFGELRFKPYLFPLSSMTEEQKDECFNGTPLEIDKYGDIAVKDDSCGNSLYTDLEIYLEVIDWLLKNHFDYRGLIEKGLAIDATGKGIY